MFDFDGRKAQLWADLHLWASAAAAVTTHDGARHGILKA
jgi:hypothetical protein